jgi:chemotaxis-related protein WspD
MKDCWNQIGVWSGQGGQCDKLPVVIHCRNCEVYTDAARQALEKYSPKDYADQWAQNYIPANPQERKKSISIVLFRLGRDWFGLPTVYFKSIEDINFIHSIPRFSNEFLLGLVNIRGTLQLCFSVKNLLQINHDNGSAAANAVEGVYKRLLVLANNNQCYVLPVEEVAGVERIAEATLEALSATTDNRSVELIQGTVKTPRQRIALLNTARLFSTLEAAIGDR